MVFPMALIPLGFDRDLLSRDLREGVGVGVSALHVFVFCIFSLNPGISLLLM